MYQNWENWIFIFINFVKKFLAYQKTPDARDLLVE